LANKRIEDLVQFELDSTNYSIIADLEKDGVTLDSWMQDASENFSNTSLTNYNKTILDGQTAYQAKDSLITIAKKDRFVYVIVAHRGLTPSTNLNDPIYKHLVETFKFTN